MTSRPGTTSIRSRRRRAGMLAAVCLIMGMAAGILLLPQYVSNATTTAVSTTYKTATNETTGSVAASSDAPGGAKTGTAKPGDTIKWVISYANKTTANAAVTLTDLLTSAGTFIPGSLQLPPNPNPKGSSRRSTRRTAARPGSPARPPRGPTVSASPARSCRQARSSCHPRSPARPRPP
ncbi:hypothetical protein [Leifsonia xyli]|uniref:hypothetical protein n=1 Tax=Leifsonia xyli TaxID=1575 RepID=UPI003D670DEF